NAGRGMSVAAPGETDPALQAGRTGTAPRQETRFVIMDNALAPRILMCPPDYFGIEYEINPWMNIRLGSDAERSLRQWTALDEALQELGVAVDLIEPVPGLPDLVFTANAGLVYRNLFISSNFRFGVRQGETVRFEAWAQRRGLEVVR